MELKTKILKLLREGYGEFDSHLEVQYQETVSNNLTKSQQSNNRNNVREWVTYNQVILEFKNNLRDFSKVKELQYRITDQEDPTEVCIEVIKESKQRSPELNRLYFKLMNF